MKRVIALIVLLLLLSACGGTDAINWDDRVGVYTYEQAAQDWGEANGKQELSNGDTLYLWYDQGKRGWYNVLGLVFAPDGTLVEVEKNDRE